MAGRALPCASTSRWVPHASAPSFSWLRAGCGLPAPLPASAWQGVQHVPARHVTLLPPTAPAHPPLLTNHPPMRTLARTRHGAHLQRRVHHAVAGGARNRVRNLKLKLGPTPGACCSPPCMRAMGNCANPPTPCPQDTHVCHHLFSTMPHYHAQVGLGACLNEQAWAWGHA